MVITDGEKAITLDELAVKLCNEISGADAGGCYDGSCPAADYCRHKHNGMTYWLREVLKNEQN